MSNILDKGQATVKIELAIEHEYWQDFISEWEILLDRLKELAEVVEVTATGLPTELVLHRKVVGKI